jgi:hypothetical protein
LAFKDTSFFERYMLNAYQFSAAKTASTQKTLQYLVYDSKKELKPFKDYYEDAEKVTNIVCDTWMRTEYDNASKCAVAGEEYQRFDSDKDLYPYWVFHTSSQHDKEDECDDLDGMVFQIGDDEGDRCFPPNHWSCQCVVEQADSDDVKENDYHFANDEDTQEFLRNSVDEDFRFNPGKQCLPNEGNYFDDLPSANDSNWKLFDVEPESEKYSSEYLFFDAKGMTTMMQIYQGWKDDYHVNSKHQIIFQNKKTLANVKFDDISFHNIEKNMRGFENLPTAIEKPTEIWSKWVDKKKQSEVLRNYILTGKINYVVQTKNGHIENAFACAKSSLNQYRKGLPL